MISLEQIIAFFFASVILALTPGPDILFVIALTLSRGRTPAFFVSLGLASGLLVHTAGIALGFASLLRASPLAFELLRYGGALYLLYLSWSTLRNRDTKEKPHARGVGRSAKTLYLRGFIMNVTNPKVLLFFLAFVPGFIHPERGFVAIQAALLGITFALSTILVFGSVIIIAGSGRRLFGAGKREWPYHWIEASLYAFIAVLFLFSVRV